MSDATCKTDECTNCLSNYDTVRASIDPCAVALSIDGGGDSFECYTDLEIDASVFESGNFFTEGWHIALNLYGIIAMERYQSYSVGTAVDANLDNDIGWTGTWDIDENWMAEVARETFEDYVTTTGMDAGEGFTGAWSVAENT